VRVPIRKNLKLGRAAGVPSPARGGRHDSDVREEGGCRGIFNRENCRRARSSAMTHS